MSDFDQSVETKLEELAREVVTGGGWLVTEATVREAKAGILSGYASYKLQKAVGEQTKELIKWSRRLMYATGFLALFTFVLALVTAVKP